MTDNMTQQIFNILDDLQICQKTIVVFSFDHGETLGQIFRRAAWLQSSVINVPLWFYIPQKYSKKRHLDTSYLRENSNKLTFNLDILPTLLDALQLQVKFYNSRDDPIYTGDSLFKPISNMRVIVGWQGKPFFVDCFTSQAYLANETHIVFFRANKNQAQMEVLNDDQTIKVEIEWDEVPVFEKK